MSGASLLLGSHPPQRRLHYRAQIGGACVGALSVIYLLPIKAKYENGCDRSIVGWRSTSFLYDPIKDHIKITLNSHDDLMEILYRKPNLLTFFKTECPDNIDGRTKNE